MTSEHRAEVAPSDAAAHLRAVEEQEVFNAELLETGRRLPGPGTVPVEVVRRNRITGGGGLPTPRSVPEGVDASIDGVPVRIFTPDKVNGVYLHFHGGGWVFGSIWEQDAMLWRIARTASLAVVTVGYRLAPEHPFPAATDDGERVLLWLIGHAHARFGTDRILLGAESAGAHVAVTSLIRLRDRHQAAGAVAAAQLSYGIYDLTLRGSQRDWRDRTMVLSTPWLEWFYDQVTPGFDERARQHPEISPLYADLAGLPPALFTVGTEDPLLDDTVEMAAAWQLDGNPSELAVYPRGPHGLNAYPTATGRSAQQRITSFLSRYGEAPPAVAVEGDPLAVARQWRNAVEHNDMAAYRALFRPDATVWTSMERRDRPLDEHVALVATARARCEEWKYHVIRSERTHDGFFAQQRVRLVSGGVERFTVAVVIGVVAGGVIAHLDEYFNRTVEPLD